jgi:hypothetical protein
MGLLIVKVWLIADGSVDWSSNGVYEVSFGALEEHQAGDEDGK